MKVLRRTLAGLLAVALASTPASAQYTQSIAAFSGPAVLSGFSSFNVGTFTGLPAGTWQAGSISGFWGNSDFALSTAGVDVFLGGILVAQCVAPDPNCWQNSTGPRAWSYTFSAAELTTLSALGPSITMTATQTSSTFIRLGVTTLTVQAVPEPATALLLAPAFIAFGMTARRRRNI